MKGAALRVHRAMHRAPISPISFPFIKIVLIASGWTVITHRDRAIPLTEGDVAFLPFGASVGAEPLSIVETVTFYVDRSFLHQQMPWFDHREPVVALLHSAADENGRIAMLSPAVGARSKNAEQARRLARLDALGSARSTEFIGASLTFLSRLSTPVAPIRHSIPRKEIRAVLDAIRTDLPRNWTLGVLARHANLSTSQLTRLFNASLGASPVAVIQRLRAERMAELLLNTDMSVTQCAERVGWHDPDYASRLMKRIYGVSARRYRTLATKMES